jgi:hypothetical protein
LIAGFIDLFSDIEDTVRDCDSMLKELRAELALDPPPIPIVRYMKQIEKRKVA